MTVSAFEIPLSASPQIMSIPLNNTTYNLTFTWREGGVVCPGGWAMDIADINNNSLVAGLMLTTGRDLLEQFAYLGFNGSMVMSSDGNIYDPPTFDNLGIGSHLYFLTNS